MIYEHWIGYCCNSLLDKFVEATTVADAGGAKTFFPADTDAIHLIAKYTVEVEACKSVGLPCVLSA